MAILGVGTDICQIDRVEGSLSRLGEAFAKRILTDQEMAVFHQRTHAHRFLAKRFAAKEAAAKALGTGIACGVTFHDFEISNDDKGKPLLTLQGAAKKRFEAMAGQHIHLSISDEKQYAVATVIYEA
ncbi:holo-ACP synthase [Thaumasiovibrio subtropicus]|uniref:holo-ACP synthase n=1 Tax=Thaumasiovibrio subtropicus TaxID=1891207 RepID=UPI000B3637B1|nr:holo-ACP synthase [Thaumasiovibrio subtropicus]